MLWVVTFSGFLPSFTSSCAVCATASAGHRLRTVAQSQVDFILPSQRNELHQLYRFIAFRRSYGRPFGRAMVAQKRWEPVTKSFGLAMSVALGVCAVAWAAPAPNAPIPDLSGIWWHPSLPGPEPLDKGPTGLKNLKRRVEDGASDYNQLVGDYNNPILKPVAAAAVKKMGEMALAGIVAPSPANQCWPEPGPSI